MIGSAGGPNSSSILKNELRRDAARNGSAPPGPGPGRLEWPAWSFIRTLFLKGLARFCRTPKFHSTCFFVHKNQGRQRLSVDARDVTRHFKRPRGVALVCTEALAGLECHGGSSFWNSTVDVRDAFHRMALPQGLSDCFALPG